MLGSGTPLQDFLLKSEAAFKAHTVWASSPGEHQQQAIEVRLLWHDTRC